MSDTTDRSDPGFDASEDLRMQETLAPEDVAGVGDGDDLRSLPTMAVSSADDDAEPEPNAPTAPIAQAAEPEPDSDAPQAPQSGELRVGMAVGKYQLIRELGHGGMGVVFLARDTRLGRLVAIKFLRSHSRAMNARFIAEARTTAQCSHDNIVIVYEADEHGGQPYMVLEYLEGQTLGDRLSERKAVARRVGEVYQVLPVAHAVQMIEPVLHALERAHGMGIVHRDLKPANVMLTSTGGVKVLDFGIAKVLDERRASPDEPAPGTWSDAPGDGESATEAAAGPNEVGHTQGMIGTLPYMSPEQISAKEVDERTDIWAVGIMLYEMVTGEHPLAPLSMHKLEQVGDLTVPMPRASEMRPDLGKLGTVIDRCLIKSVSDRISSARELREQIAPLGAGQHGAALDGDERPFTGLSAFQEGDASRFFGREKDIANLSAQVRQQPLVAVIGPSGAGKSSLIRAGVIPALKQSGEGWETLIIRPGRAPLDSLIDVVDLLQLRTSTGRFDAVGDAEADAGPGAGPGAEVPDRAALVDRLRAEPGFLGTEMRAWAGRKLRRVLLFVDQFEEIYTAQPAPAERAAFLACLASIGDDASSPLRVVLTMRSDFLERMSMDRSFITSVKRGLVFLTPLDRDGLRAALEKPVEQVGYRFETPAMIDDMLAELENTSGALPLMQFAASELWDARDRERRLLTEASYEAMGGVAGALAQHADQVLAAMPAQLIKLVRAVFERLVTPERTRAIVSVSELYELPGDPADIDEMLQALVDARLVVMETGDEKGDRSRLAAMRQGKVEIVHESLITRWPTLRHWLDEGAGDAEFLARLRSAARAWNARDRADGMLWSGEVVYEARHWRERYQEDLPELEAAFLDAAFAGAERATRRTRRILTGTIAGLVVMTVTGLAVAYMAMQDKKATERVALKAQRAEAEARAEKSEARRAQMLMYARQGVRARDVERDVRKAMHWFARAATVAPDEPGQRASRLAVAVLASQYERTLASDVEILDDARFSADDSRILSRSADGSVRHRSGSRVLTWDLETIRLWDSLTGEPIGAPLRLEERVEGIHWSKDESRVLTWTRNGIMRLWSFDFALPIAVLDHEQPVVRALWSANESQIVTWGEDGTARRWQLPDVRQWPVAQLELRIQVQTRIRYDDTGDPEPIPVDEWLQLKRQYEAVTGRR